MAADVIEFPARGSRKSALPHDEAEQADAFEAIRQLKLQHVSAMINAANDCARLKPEEAAPLARNLDALICQYRGQVSLSELCQRVGLGDGKDPKALYPYRLSAGVDHKQRKIAVKPRKYLEIATQLARMAKKNETEILRKVLSGTVFSKRVNGGLPDARIEIVEMFDAMVEWVRRTTRIDYAFGIAVKNKAGFYPASASHIQFGPGAPRSGYPELRLFRKPVPDPHHVSGACQMENGEEATYSNSRIISLQLHPSHECAAILVFCDYEICEFEYSKGKFELVGMDVSESGYKFYLENGEVAYLHDEAVGELWMRANESGMHVEDEEYVSELDGDYWTFLNAADVLDDRAAMMAPKELEWFKSEIEDRTWLRCYPADGWAEFTVSYGESPYSVLVSSFQKPKGSEVPTQTHPEQIPTSKLAYPFDYPMTNPDTGWIVADPNEGKFLSLPDYMWREANRYAEAVIAAFEAQKTTELLDRERSLEKMRGSAPDANERSHD